MSEQSNDRFFLNPNEMAFRKIYWPLIESEQVTKVFRPGDRSCGCWRGYCSGQEIELKVIDKIGVDWARVEPIFDSGLCKKVAIREVIVKRIKDLIDEDFKGATPDVYDQASLRYNLGVIYNFFPEELTDDTPITITTFAYL